MSLANGKGDEGKLSLTMVRREDWAESWKRHFRPLTVGPRLLVKPSWSQRQGRKGQQLVVLDPGLSFGTGQHPTTAFCLWQLVTWRRDDIRQSLLDIGTGSGILAIAAAKLGYHPVDAFDSDPDAVRIARRNACQNRLESGVRIRQQDLMRLPARPTRTYSVICANLISPLLLASRKLVISRLQPLGVLIVAGILRTEFGEIRRAYEAAGLKLVARRTAGEWRSGAFRRGSQMPPEGRKS